MSVHQESLDMSKSTDTMEEAPELEYSSVRSDSLAMFGAAIGGAVLGVGLTLLILAIINGGTLNFTGGSNVAELEARLSRVDENLGATSANIDTVAAQAEAAQEQLAQNLSDVEAGLSDEISRQDGEIATINQELTSLNVSRQQFNHFVGALATTLSELESMGEETNTAAPAAPVASAEEVALPTASSSADVAPRAVAVFVFVDGNGNGRLDGEESVVEGVAVAIHDGNGSEIASDMTGPDGALFQDLEAGDYTVTIQDQMVEVSVANEDSEGLVVWVPVTE